MTMIVSPRGLKLEQHDTAVDCIDVRPMPFGRFVLNSEHQMHSRYHLKLLISLWNDQGLRWLMRPDQVEKIAAVLGIQGSYDELIQDKRQVELEGEPFTHRCQYVESPFGPGAPPVCYYCNTPSH